MIDALLGALPLRPDTVIGLSTVALSLIAKSVSLVYVCAPPPALTVTDEVLVLVAPSSSVTVSVTL